MRTDKPAVEKDLACELIKTFLDRAIEHRLRFMRNEASVLVNDLEVAIHRLQRDGGAAYLGDIKSGAWYKAAAELRMLQRTRRALQAIGDGNTPDDLLFEGIKGNTVDPLDPDV